MVRVNFSQGRNSSIESNTNYPPQHSHKEPPDTSGAMEYEDLIIMEYEDLVDMEYEG